MARLCPTLPPRAALSAGDHAELELLETLERGLPAAYLLFHGIDWARSDGERVQLGEVDIVVLNQAGDVLLLEVKAGAVDMLDGGLSKSYGGRSKDVLFQARQQHSAILAGLRSAGLSVQVGHLLVLPDVKLSDSAHAAVLWPRQRLVDSGDMPQVVSRVMRALGAGVADAAVHGRVQAFFENRFRVQTDVSAMAGRLRQVSRRLSAGLSTWVPRMAVPSGLVRVMGTAGSGKTQLALRLLRDADLAGQRAAYLCFNRALADHMATVAPVRTPVETFHELALRLARRDGLAIDLGSSAGFAQMTAHALRRLDEVAPDLDLLVLDEVQDLQPAWVQAVLGRLKPQGRAVLLEDPAQQLYKDREPFDLTDAVTVRSNENFRSPRALVGLINLLRLADEPVEALSPHQGELPDPIVYASVDRVAEATSQAVQRCLDRGFALDDIAIVSLMGRERSALQSLDSLGPWRLRRFTGRFDAGGGAVWTDGPLLIDSVRRFKGQAAPAVVLTECDLPDLAGLNARLLFVALTRAVLHLEWVVSPGFTQVLQAAIID